MSAIATPEHKRLAGRLRDLYSLYTQNEDLISIGAYKSVTNPELDYAISKIKQINQFLTQNVEEPFSVEQTVNILQEMFDK